MFNTQHNGKSYVGFRRLEVTDPMPVNLVIAKSLGCNEYWELDAVEPDFGARELSRFYRDTEASDYKLDAYLLNNEQFGGRERHSEFKLDASIRDDVFMFAEAQKRANEDEKRSGGTYNALGGVILALLKTVYSDQVAHEAMDSINYGGSSSWGEDIEDAVEREVQKEKGEKRRVQEIEDFVDSLDSDEKDLVAKRLGL